MQPPSAPAPSPPPVPPRRRLDALSLLLGGLIVAVASGALILLLRRPTPPSIVLQPPPTATPAPTPTLTPTPAPIVVFVSGAVQQPGLYSLPPGARAADALVQAGGFAPDADVNAVNQAELLYDGARVHVPAAGDVAAVDPPSGVSGERSGSVVDVSGPDETTAGRVNLNTASAAELENLPGIGPAKAEAIIAGRPYASVDDLERIDGIGPKLIEQLRDQVTAQ